MPRTPSKTRIVVARTLVVLGALLAVVTIVAGYVRWQALDTKTFSTTAARLIEDPVIRDQVAGVLADQIRTNVDLTAAVKERLPEDQQGLAIPIAGVISQLLDRTAQEVLARPRVQRLFVAAAAFSHERLIRILDDDVRGLETRDGYLVLDLRPLVVDLGDRIGVIGKVADRLPADAGVVRIMRADRLEETQDLVQTFKKVAPWIWVFPLLLWGLAVWLVPGRRWFELRAVALSLLVVGLLVLVVRRAGGNYIVGKLAGDGSDGTAAHHVWAIVTDLLRDGALSAVIISLFALAGLWLTGRSERSSRVRERIAPALERADIAYGAGAVIMLLLIWWGPTVQFRRPLFVLVAAALLALGITVLRLTVRREMRTVEAPRTS